MAEITQHKILWTIKRLSLNSTQTGSNIKQGIKSYCL